MTTETQPTPEELRNCPGGPYELHTDGTAYKWTTPQAVREVLSNAIRTGQRLVLEYGDAETGKEWGDSERGRMGRSMGPVRVPLALGNVRSTGGSHVLDSCIVRIVATPAPRRILYEHPALARERAERIASRRAQPC